MATNDLETRVKMKESAKIADWLGSDALDTLLTAKERLDQNKPEAVEILRDLLQRDVKAYRTGMRRFWTLMLIVLTVAFLVLCCILNRTEAVSALAPYLFMPCWLAAPLLIAWYDAHQTSKRRLRNTVTLLRRYGDTQAVSALVEAMECGEGETAYEAERALTLLLQALKPADHALLAKMHHAALQRALYGYHSDLILAILQAFEQIGDPADIDHVRYLTNCPEWIARSGRIRAAAQRCLSVLEKRAELQWGEQTYLRAAAPPTYNDMLLRAAQDGAPVLQHQLLRAARWYEPF